MRQSTRKHTHCGTCGVLLTNSTRCRFCSGDCYRAERFRIKVCTIEGCGKPLEARGWCRLHYGRWRRNGDPGGLERRKQGRPVRPGGFVNGYGYRQVKVDGRWRPEHQVVMEAHIGRPLVKQENVHHKNGHRSDNRLENLELWSTGQPRGQRAIDKLVWAREIVALYGEAEQLHLI